MQTLVFASVVFNKEAWLLYESLHCAPIQHRMVEKNTESYRSMWKQLTILSY